MLNPASAFREGWGLVSEEPDLRDVSLYFSVLTALASGHTRRTQLAAALGRPQTPTPSSSTWKASTSATDHDRVVAGSRAG